MMIHLPVVNVSKLSQRFKHAALGMFNLNDSKWGRDGEKPTQGGADLPPVPPSPTSSPTGSQDKPNHQAPQDNKRPHDGPPDLDELWHDFNQKLGGIFGGAQNKGRQQPNGGGNNHGGNGNGGGFQPDMKSAGKGAVLVGVVAALIWLGTGFFIVQEGQQAVITRFGELKGTREAGFNWRLPYPIERHETVALTQLRSIEIGRGTTVQATGLKDSSMLTQDENIVDIKFTVQYRLKSAADFLFQNRNPDDAVTKAAESAIREVVGKGAMDTVLNKDRESIQRDVLASIQAQMDRYKTGIHVQTVNIQNVQPPEPVQAAFDDALKAGQDRDRLKNEGQAYANDVVPRAKGTAARLKEEADGYKANVIARAEGDAQRFKSIQAEYSKAPQVTRDRLYIDTMQQIYSNVTKVVVDSKQGNNLLYLPLDKIMQLTAAGPNTTNGSTDANAASSASSATPVAPIAPNAADSRSRDTSRSR
ncbi:MAG TPA: FtsH protease activity modulator HflK [Burkholderiaceae bacterium]|nr:FtsH protease activity modulator HflK [Burkholderiaceae bacterium]